MSVLAMPPYPNTIPASAFSPTANDDNVWMAHARGRCAPGERLDLRHGRPPGWRGRAVLYAGNSSR